MHKSQRKEFPRTSSSKYGADMVRLWAPPTITAGIAARRAIFKQLSDKYLKIRNTPVNLGNIDAALTPTRPSRARICRLEVGPEPYGGAEGKVHGAYERYDFIPYLRVNNFCVVEMSNFYLDVIKAGFYATERTASPAAAPRPPCMSPGTSCAPAGRPFWPLRQ